MTEVRAKIHKELSLSEETQTDKVSFSKSSIELRKTSNFRILIRKYRLCQEIRSNLERITLKVQDWVFCGQTKISTKKTCALTSVDSILTEQPFLSVMKSPLSNHVLKIQTSMLSRLKKVHKVCWAKSTRKPEFQVMSSQWTLLFTKTMIETTVVENFEQSIM